MLTDYVNMEQMKNAIDTLWYQSSYDLDVRSDFGKLFVRKKLVRWNHSCIKYALIKSLKAHYWSHHSNWKVKDLSVIRQDM